MCTTGGNAEIIILSDGDDDDDKENDLSCIIVEAENSKKPDCVPPPSSQDEDLVVTFFRRADVLPHARYDCPVHPFTTTYCETGHPVDSNQLICDQCFCYICDKLASMCVSWCHHGVCHCNGHKKSDFWNNIRNAALLGELKAFNFTLSEVDSHLRHAETMLQIFRKEISALFSSFMLGQTLHQRYNQNQQGLVQDYTPVFELVSSFLNKADEQDCRAAAVMHLGAAEELIRCVHFMGPVDCRLSPTATASDAKIVLLQRMIKTVQRHIVMGDFTPPFINKLQDFYQKKMYFPVELKGLKNSLCVRTWDDILLVSVLKGQNVSGFRKDKGKKDILTEQISVILLRAELLQHQRRYRELCRYLRVVQTNDSRLLQQIQDLIPFFMCMEGDFPSALMSLYPSVNAPASRFTPQLFLFYLQVFKTATAPQLTVSQLEQLCCSDASWEPIKDAVPLKRVELVKFALKAQRFSLSVYTDSQCWSTLLRLVNSHGDTPSALPAPSPKFLYEARDVVKSLLFSEDNIRIPRSFLEVYPDQALLLLVTGALGFRILKAPLSPALPVLNNFKDNLWAFQWLCENLTSNEVRLDSFLQEVRQEAANTTGSPLAAKLISQVKFPSQIQTQVKELLAASSSGVEH